MCALFSGISLGELTNSNETFMKCVIGNAASERWKRIYSLIKCVL